MALFNAKRLVKKVKPIPYKGKADPKETKVKALKLAEEKKVKAIKEAERQLQKSLKKVEVIEEKVSEEIKE